MARQDTDEIAGTSRQRVQDRALRAAIWSARRLPYERRVPFFGMLARRVIVPALGQYARIEENLDYVFPVMPAEERRRIARGSADTFGRVTIENYSTRELVERCAAIEPTGAGVATLAEAHQTGRGALLLTAHFGNYQAARACLIGQGYPVGGIYRPMANPYFNEHYVRTMEIEGGGPVFPTGPAGSKAFIGFLRKGGFAGLLNDLYIGSGVELPFLGKPAMTSLSAAQMALKFGAALIPAFATRLPNGLDFAVELDAEIPHTDPETMTREYNAALERRVLAHPEQWFWIHRRWKRKWQGGKGAGEDLHPAAMPTRQHRKAG